MWSFMFRSVWGPVIASVAPSAAPKHPSESTGRHHWYAHGVCVATLKSPRCAQQFQSLHFSSAPSRVSLDLGFVREHFCTTSMIDIWITMKTRSGISLNHGSSQRTPIRLCHSKRNHSHGRTWCLFTTTPLTSWLSRQTKQWPISARGDITRGWYDIFGKASKGGWNWPGLGRSLAN